MKENGICCFCGKIYNHYGNDVRPIVTATGDRCCDECNQTIVIPTRLAAYNNTKVYYVLVNILSNKLINKEGFECEYLTTPFDKLLISEDINNLKDIIKEYQLNNCEIRTITIDYNNLRGY